MRSFYRLWPVAAVGCALAAGLAGCRDGGDVSVEDHEADMNRPVETTDVTVGEGEAVGDGWLVNIEYVGKFPGAETTFDRNDKTDDQGQKVSPPFAVLIGGQDAVEGMQEGIIGMKVGGVRDILVPWNKAYGAEGLPDSGIPAKQDLQFRVTLLGSVKPGEEAVYDFEDVKVGTGREVKEGDKVTCHYKGTYLNGMMFDDSRKRGDRSQGGTPLEFKVGATQAIRGMDTGVRGMKVGGVRKIWIPPGLAFGNAGFGTIQAKQIIWIEVEILSIG
jgi:FKBP-type peptidyl-prolyl cis-trans isomerase